MRAMAAASLVRASLGVLIALGWRITFAYADPALSVAPTDRNITYFGRWDRRDPALARSHWGGAYLRTRFSGTFVGLKMVDRQRLVVSIDGEPFRAVDGQAGITPLAAGPLAPGLHTLLAGSSTGGEVQFQGLTLDANATTKQLIPRPIVEFIGDSITWGTGPKDLWNVNYTWQTAEALGCDHAQIAQSARALTTGFGCADEKTGMDRQYFMMKNFGYVHESPPIPWHMDAYTPRIIVINLGQNDACGNEPDAVFTASYVDFLKRIRSTYPGAEIVALRMFGGGRFGDDTKRAVGTRIAAGDRRVHFIDTAGWLATADFADGVHPNAMGNLKAALRLAPMLEPLLPAAAQRSLAAKTVGDPANPAGLAQALQNAYVRGERSIVITPGTYLLGSHAPAQILLDHWQNAEISAYKTTLMLDNDAANVRLFLLDNCRNVRVRGALLSQTRQTAYQGRVTALGHDDAGRPTCDWRPSTGYPVPPAGTKELWSNFVDAKSRTVNIPAGDYYHAKLRAMGGGSFRIDLEDRPIRFAVGDWMVARYGEPPNKVFLANCRDCTIQDVTLMRNGFAPIFESEGGANHFLACHWVLGPRPAGATEDPVVTNAADGLHSPDANPGPDIERCTFDGVFLDDCIAIHGGYHGIVRVDGSTIVAQNGYAFYAVGEPVRISDDRGFYVQANVTALKDNGDGTSTLTLDTTATIPLGAKLSNPLADGHGYKIIGCQLGNTRSRGIIVKSDDGVIRDNVITHCGLAIRIGPEWPQEADYCRNVLVEGNTIAANGEGIIVDGAGVKENVGITLRNNRLQGNTGGDISIAWAANVTLAGNTFTAPDASPAVGKPGSPIQLRDVSDIYVVRNRIMTPARYPSPTVAIGKNVTHLTLVPEP
jgi:lysophospholipase L1-like esterase